MPLTAMSTNLETKYTLLDPDREKEIVYFVIK